MAGDAKSETSHDEMVKSIINPDLSSKSGDANTAPKDGVSDANSCISSVDAMGSIKESDLDQEPMVPEQTLYYPAAGYYGYYYPSPGFDNSYVDWNDPSFYVGADGLDMQQPVLQSDGSLVYYMPGYLPQYDPYSSVMSPGAVIGADGQQYLAAQQQYVMSPVMSPQPLGSSPTYYHNQPSSPYVYGSGGYAYPWDSYYSPVGGFDGNYGVPAANKPRPAAKKNGPAGGPNSNNKLNAPADKKGLSVEVLPPGADVPAMHLKHGNKAPILAKGCFPASKLPSYGHQTKPGMMYADAGALKTHQAKTNTTTNNGYLNFDMLAEQNRGPRTANGSNNNPKTASWVTTTGADPAGVPSTAAPESDNNDKAGTVTGKTVIIRRDDYNLVDFPTKYEHAMFFVIKSYSEDDIHKSIKYNVWASTPNGNKRLDAAYQAAQEKAAEKGGVKCPIFLFFSVNASGQFCGVAEMVGRVDFSKNMDFWQQDKWNGYFPVKWHMIKDVPNAQFRQIILENNDNKPVTNSRDTQEVRFPQGSQMLTLFKDYSCRTSILDDFGFYENRQKVMLEKRSRMVAATTAVAAVAPPSLAQFLPKPEEAGVVVKKAVAAAPADDVKLIISGLEALDLGNAPTEGGAQPEAVLAK